MLTARRLVWIAAAAALVFIALSAALRLRPIAATTVPAPRRPALAVGVALDRRPPAVELRDARGKPTSLAALRGRWLAIAPAMTLCQEVCPLTTGALIRLRTMVRRAGAGNRFAVLELSTDPWRDRPRRLRAYRRLTGAQVPILTGSVAAVRRLWGFFGVHFARVPPDRPAPRDWLTGRPLSFDVEHTDGLFLIDPSGRERVAIAGAPNLRGRLATPLRSLLDRQGRRNLADPNPGAGWSPAAAALDLRRLIGIDSGPASPPPAAATRRRLAASPPPLARLRRQAGQLFEQGRLGARLESLRGHPAVVNAWASWCPPCREELPLFTAAAARFGDRVAFLGADAEDQAGDARRLLAELSPGYPSYEVSLSELRDLLGPVRGTPVTFFIGPDGELVGEHIGAYSSQSSLDADIRELVPEL